jgi:alpha-galactosidase
MKNQSFAEQKKAYTCPATTPRVLDRSRATLMGYGRIAAVWTVAMVLTVPAFAQTDITISTEASPATPRILGPTIIGATPGSPFLYTVPATGQAPLTFAATGLPDGLSIDASSGTISGTTPAAGSYSIAVTVTNSSGSATATLTLTAGSTVALTPPMGWNSYDSYGASVTESEVMSAAQAVKTQLQPFGWNTVVVDYLWFDTEKVIDSNGRYLPSPSKYPSATGNQGFKPLADQVHALGLNFGIHIMRGIPRSAVAANSPIANSSYTASQAGNTSDACPWNDANWGVRGDTDAGKAWYDSIFAQYAEWGVDFVKVDDMMNPYGGNAYHQTEVDAIRAAIDKTGRSIVLSLSPGPNQTRDVVNLNANANMWRIVNDFWDTNGLSKLSDEFDTAFSWSITSGITQGHWPDADMLPLGYLGPRCPAHGSGPNGLSHNQQVTVMTLWGIMPSPLMFGGNPTQLSGDTWTIALLTNDEVLAVNQDAAGNRATRVSQQGTTEVWARDLSGGRKAVALFNRGTLDATVSVTFAELGVSDTVTVRDLWNRQDMPGMTSDISVNVPHEGAMLYTLTPPGGTSGTGGTGDTGGVGGTGETGTGGVGGEPTGGTETGGNTAQSGGTSGSGQPIGGSAASGGSGVTAGAAGLSGAGGTSEASGGTSGGDQGGCNCRMTSHRSGNGWAAWLGLALLVWRRRRRARSA